MKNFDFIAGSLAIDAPSSPFILLASQIIKEVFYETNGYFAYKFISISKDNPKNIPTFLIVSQEYGILIVDIIQEKVLSTIERDEEFYWKIGDEFEYSRETVVFNYEEDVKNRLRTKPLLFNKKKKIFNVEINTLLVFCENNEYQELLDPDLDNIAVNFSELKDYLEAFHAQRSLNTPLSDEVFAQICSQIEGTYIFEKEKNINSLLNEQSLVTVNDFIEESLNVTFKQDRVQRQISMQLPNGIQRIRGLAGTGKTIVLCLKAALTHSTYKDFKILYLFNTQSLYKSIQNLITKYYGAETGLLPDFENKIDIYHAWGGAAKAGLYSELCKSLGLKPLSFNQLRGSGDPLKSLYKDLLAKASNRITPVYDLVLIDEAQDFAPEIFEVVYKLTKGEGDKKRIIWAYDEFQSLKDTVIREPEDLFGRNAEGEPNILNASLNGNYEGDIPKDFTLPNCYRTPRPVLMTAHGVAMGLYAPQKTHMFYEKTAWNAIGYNVIQPTTHSIPEKIEVILERPDSNSRNTLEKLLTDNGKPITDLIKVQEVNSTLEQFDYISSECHRLINVEKVAPEQIIIINLSKGDNKHEMIRLRNVLAARGMNSVIPGYVESPDIFQPKDHITITTPFRAKGNESNIVFLINSQLVADDHTPRTRNSFFVSLTRSRGWCYVVGEGEGIKKLKHEISGILRNFPTFNFISPLKSEVTGKLDYLSRSDSEIDEINRIVNIINNNPEILNLLDENVIAKLNLKFEK